MDCGTLCRIVMVIFTLLALIMQVLTSTSCSLVELEGTNKTLGMFYRGDPDGCDSYETRDPFILSARSMLVLSTYLGIVAGSMVLLEWKCCRCTVLCYGCTLVTIYILAWMMSGLSFLFYGANICTLADKEFIEEFIDEYGMDTMYKLYVEQFNGTDFLAVVRNSTDPNITGCNPSMASHFMTVASVCYTVCILVLCCTPPPGPSEATTEGKSGEDIGTEKERLAGTFV